MPILNDFNEQQEQGVDHQYEAKLLLIGEGGTGKTSLMWRLYQTDKTLPDGKNSTKDIDIYRHVLKLHSGRDFQFNVRDFGGREIHHATHQCFLTKRSLYISLVDTRNNNNSVHNHVLKLWKQTKMILSRYGYFRKN
ncbi:MAG: hypothetical protein K0U68_09640 [Gammaproteobacteria bacterium]|nr:hypothetical protein [Gammaproteobacteria bacterium]